MRASRRFMGAASLTVVYDRSVVPVYAPAYQRLLPHDIPDESVAYHQQPRAQYRMSAESGSYHEAKASPTIVIERLHEDVRLPARATACSAGFALRRHRP